MCWPGCVRMCMCSPNDPSRHVDFVFCVVVVQALACLAAVAHICQLSAHKHTHASSLTHKRYNQGGEKVVVALWVCVYKNTRQTNLLPSFPIILTLCWHAFVHPCMCTGHILSARHTCGRT